MHGLSQSIFGGVWISNTFSVELLTYERASFLLLGMKHGYFNEEIFLNLVSLLSEESTRLSFLEGWAKPGIPVLLTLLNLTGFLTMSLLAGFEPRQFGHRQVPKPLQKGHHDLSNSISLLVIAPTPSGFWRNGTMTLSDRGWTKHKKLSVIWSANQ